MKVADDEQSHAVLRTRLLMYKERKAGAENVASEGANVWRTDTVGLQQRPTWEQSNIGSWNISTSCHGRATFQSFDYFPQ